MSATWRGFTLPTLDEFAAHGWDTDSDEWILRHYATTCQAAIVFTAFPKTKTVRPSTFSKDLFYGLPLYTGGARLIGHGYLSREAWKIAMRAAGFTVSRDGYEANTPAAVRRWVSTYLPHLGRRADPTPDLDAPAFPEFLPRVGDALDWGDEFDLLGVLSPIDQQARGPMFTKETKA